MEELRLTLLGGLQLTLGDHDITDRVSTKAQALLCYLAMTGRTHPRQVLAGLLWGEKPEADARRSLRVDLVPMRRLLESHLIITRQALAFDGESRYWSDVEAFEHFIQLSGEAEGGAVERARLREAVALYRGEFLDGFDVGEAAPDFEEWMLAQRERLRQIALQAFDRLVDICIAQEDYDAGMDYAQQLLALDSWREEAHRQLMWLLALNGKRGAALAQYEACRSILREELGVEPTEETQALYRRIRDLEGTLAEQTRPLPPLQQALEAEAIPFQAPAQVPYFTDREPELAYFQDNLLGDEEHKIYCAVGMGGVGKTALAIYLAHTLRHHFADGVLWANAATSDPMAIAESWAHAYGYDFSGLPDMESRAAPLRSMLAERQALLVLDDVTSAARIRPLLPGGGDCTVLLTTRNVELAHALGARLRTLNELDEENGRQLLTNIIGQERVMAEETAAQHICRSLHNLPLAVAIAGQHLASRPRRRLADFARRLQDESNRLDLHLGDRAVRASFAVSWEALDAYHRRVFSLLAVFEGRPFTAEALAAVAEMDRYPAQDRLDTLVALSLLGEEGERHYRQHPLLADFAGERLGAAEEEGATRRMVAYYLDYATEHQVDYDALRPEWENLSASIHLARRLQMWRTVIQYTSVLQDAWFARGRYTAARLAYQWAREASMALEDEYALASCLLYWGQACIEQNDYDEARELLAASRQLYEQLGYQPGIATNQYHLARIELEQAEYEEAERLLVESRRLREQLGDQGGVAETLLRQARLRYQRGDYVEAERLAKRALRMQEDVNDRLGSVRTLGLLANIILRFEEAEYDLAENYIQRAMKLCQELQDQAELAVVLQALSMVRRAQRDLDAARAVAEEGLELLRKMGDRRALARGLFRLSQINRDLKRYEAALAAGYQSLELCQELGDDLGTAFVCRVLGDLLHDMGEHKRAYEMWQDSLIIAQKLKHGQLIRSLQRRLNQD